MQQLSEQAAAFLADDKAHANATLSLLHVYDPSSVGGGVLRFKTLLAHIEQRLAALPAFRRKLLRLPLDLDRPYWVDDDNFDLEYHVRHIALPKPGDWRQFCIQVSRIHARPLDPARPLWELYVIEGLDGFADLPAGSFALLTKTHAAALDLEQDAEWITRLHDADAAAQAAAAPPPAWFAREAPPLLPLLARGVWRNLTEPTRLAQPLARRLVGLAPPQLALAGEALLAAPEMPLVRFNAVVSPHRVFETRRFALAEVKRIRNLVKGASVHDVVLAICAGALHRYLDAHAELPARSLVALVPLAMKAQGDTGRANAEAGRAATDTGAEPGPAILAWQRVALPTEIDDPIERLRAVCTQTASASSGAVGAREQRRAGPGRAAALLRRSAQAVARTLAGQRAPLAACSITHVPGPPGPLYLCGARLVYFSAMLPLADGLGLAIAVTSCEDRLIVSPTSCRDLMPDPERFAAALRESFDELLALARHRRQARPPRQSRAAPPARARRSTAAARQAASGSSKLP